VILPVLAISVPIAAPFAQILIRNIDAVATSPFVAVARAKGASYRQVLLHHVFGNAILPVLTIGGKAAHIPYAITWQHEVAELPEQGLNGYYHLESMDALPPLVAQLQRVESAA